MQETQSDVIIAGAGIVGLATAYQIQKLRPCWKVQILEKEGKCFVSGKNKTYESKFFINCTGLYSDRIARAAQHPTSHQILPFRGEYYELSAKKRGLVNGLIYPVPDPKFPFLGVHLTPMMNGKVEAGPNAILAFAREGYKKSDFHWPDAKEILSFPGFWKMAAKYWKAGAYELARSCSKHLFLRSLRRLVPAIDGEDLLPGGSGIKAQAVTREGKLLDDFALLQEGNCLHVINAPSPAATASFPIGRTLAEMAIKAGTS
jgi:L-2-hydroxyglutarate oxidase